MQFNKTRMNDAILRFYQRTQPIAFSNAETLYDDLIILRDQLLSYGELSNETIDYLNTFIDNYDDKLYTTTEDVLLGLLHDGTLEFLIKNSINEEVANSRGNFSKLRDRLDKVDTDIQKNQNSISNTLSKNELDSWIASLVDGTPKTFASSLTELNATYPNGSTSPALVYEEGLTNLYVYKSGQWVLFGEYQGVKPKPYSLEPNMTTFFKRTNLFNKNGVTTGGFLSENAVLSNPNYVYSDYIDVTPNSYYITDGNTSATGDMYQLNNTFVKSYSRGEIPQPFPTKTIIKVPNNVYKVRLNYMIADSEVYYKVDLDTCMVLLGQVYSDKYIPYDTGEMKVDVDFIDLKDLPHERLPKTVLKDPVVPEQTSFFNALNLFDSSKATAGGFLNNGGFVTNPQWGYSDYIDVIPNEKYIRIGRVGAVGEYYTEDNVYVSNIETIGSEQPFPDHFVFTIPDNVYKLRTNLFIGTSPTITTTPIDEFMLVKGIIYPDEYVDFNQEYQKINKKYLPVNTSSSHLHGKLLATAGDSLTNGNSYTPYGQILADRLGMRFINYGISGSTMTNVVGRQPFVGRWEQMDATIDVLTIFFGWNDQAYADLGTIDSTLDTTFYGAYKTVVNGIVAKYPNIKLVLIIPFAPQDKQAYAVAVKSIANLYGIDYLDLNDREAPLLNYRDGVLPEIITQRKADVTYDGLHLNDLGHMHLANALQPKISR